MVPLTGLEPVTPALRRPLTIRELLSYYKRSGAIRVWLSPMTRDDPNATEIQFGRFPIESTLVGNKLGI